MGNFREAITEIAADLRVGVPGVLQVQDSTPEAINEYPQILHYPAPGVWTPAQHRDKYRNVVWGGRHRLLWVWVAQPPDEGTAIDQAVEALDSMFMAIAGGFDRDRFNGTVEALYQLAGAGFGWSDEENDRHFSAGLEMELQLAYSIDNGAILGG